MAVEKYIYSDIAIPPGEYFAEVLMEKRISQAEAARRMGRPAQAINEIISGKKTITSETALQLERVLGVAAHIWTELEARFRLIKARQEEIRQCQKELPFLNEIPYVTLSRIGSVKKTRDRIEKIRELHGFFGVAALSNLRDVRAYNSAFRCSRRGNASPYALAAWLRCAELIAEEVSTKSFDKERLCINIPLIREFTLVSPDKFIPQLKELLAKCGVVLILMPHFPKTYAHGATFWPSQDRAVIMMSTRGSWADIFWFSLFHEIGHIVLHNKGQTFIDATPVDSSLQNQETEADCFAEDNLIPRQEYQKFVDQSKFAPQSIKDFAEQFMLSPGIVVGRLQHDGYLPQNSPLNGLRDRFRIQ
jgi:HTH-type transcriptional regulator/antitoxin HigA